MASILVASDFAEELNTVREQLADPHGQVLYSYSAQETETLFLTQHPLLLVLAYSDLNIALKRYRSLQLEIPERQKNSHLTLLLCLGREAETAHTLCVDGVFDDYVVNRPLHDPRRIDLSVRQLIARGMTSRDSQGLSRQLSAVGRDIRHLENIVRPTLTDIHHSQATLTQGVGRLPERLSQVLDQFRDLLRPEAAGTQSPEQLRAHLEELLKHNVDPEIQAALQQLGDSNEMLAGLENNFKILAGTLAAQPFPPPQPEILIVDDDEVYRSILVRVVEKADMRAIECEDGKSALAQACARQPDLMLVDQEMPLMTGLELLHEIRANPLIATTPVIMLTGVGTKEVVKDSMASGIQGFIAKPSNAAAILERIRLVLAKTKK